MQLGILTDAEGETPPIYTTISLSLKNYWEKLKKGLTPQQDGVWFAEWVKQLGCTQLRSNSQVSLLRYEIIVVILYMFNIGWRDFGMVRQICTERFHGPFWQKNKSYRRQVAINTTLPSQDTFIPLPSNMWCSVNKKRFINHVVHHWDLRDTTQLKSHKLWSNLQPF